MAKKKNVVPQATGEKVVHTAVNFVAIHASTFNTARVFKDRKKAVKCGDRKHKGSW